MIVSITITPSIQAVLDRIVEAIRAEYGDQVANDLVFAVNSEIGFVGQWLLSKTRDGELTVPELINFLGQIVTSLSRIVGVFF